MAASKRTERYPIACSPLYGLTNHTRLARLLYWAGTTGELRRFSRRADNYTPYFDRSRPGKIRRIEAPAKRAKVFQRRVLELLQRIELPDYLHSARPGRSYLTNSAAHCAAIGCTVTMDIESFYPSVSVARVARFFELRLMCSPDIAQTLAQLMCFDGHLATGNPASALLSFWANRELFDLLDGRVRSRGGVFTLYIDDIGITGNGVGHTDVQWVTKLLRRVGLVVKETKTRVFHAESAKVVTGRAWRYGISRAPNKQHRKMRDAEFRLQGNPGDSGLRNSVAGLRRHLALLDVANRDHHREEAMRIARGAPRPE